MVKGSGLRFSGERSGILSSDEISRVVWMKWLYAVTRKSGLALPGYIMKGVIVAWGKEKGLVIHWLCAG